MARATGKSHLMIQGSTFISTAPYSRSLELTGVRVQVEDFGRTPESASSYLVQAHFEIYERQVL